MKRLDVSYFFNLIDLEPTQFFAVTREMQCSSEILPIWLSGYCEVPSISAIIEEMTTEGLLISS